jgi:hypothetical protein
MKGKNQLTKVQANSIFIKRHDKGTQIEESTEEKEAQREGA